MWDCLRVITTHNQQTSPWSRVRPEHRRPPWSWQQGTGLPSCPGSVGHLLTQNSRPQELHVGWWLHCWCSDRWPCNRQSPGCRCAICLTQIEQFCQFSRKIKAWFPSQWQYPLISEGKSAGSQTPNARLRDKNCIEHHLRAFEKWIHFKVKTKPQPQNSRSRHTPYPPEYLPVAHVQCHRHLQTLRTDQ